MSSSQRDVVACSRSTRSSGRPACSSRYACRSNPLIVPMHAEYFSNGSEHPCVAYISDHAWYPGLSLSTISPSKSNISALRLVEPKRFLDLEVGDRPHTISIEPPLVHVLPRLDHRRACRAEECLESGIRVGFRHARFERAPQTVPVHRKKRLRFQHGNDEFRNGNRARADP